MTFAQLRAFATVARLGSVGAAAGALGVSEPAVSAHVAALRRDLDDELFVRAGGGIRLTAGGERLAAAAAEILGLADRARREVREARGERGLLRLAVTPPVAEFASAPLLDAFTRRRPALEVAQEIAPADAFDGMLFDRHADVVLGPSPPRDPAVYARPFLRCKLAVVAAPGHPLARRRRVGGETLARERWLAGPGGEGRVRAFLARRGARREPDVRVFPSETAAVSAAADGLGTTLAIARTVIEPLRRRDVALVDADGAPEHELWHAAALTRHSDAAASLLSFLTTADATQAMIARPGGVPAGRFRPPVYVTIWSEPRRQAD